MTAAILAKRLIGDEKLVSGVKLPEARQIIARQAGLSPGTLENLGRGRLKRTEWVRDRLHALLIKKLEQRIAAAQHDLRVAKAIGRIPEATLANAERALAEAERALGK